MCVANGLGVSNIEAPDYDCPKSLKASQAMEDYDFPAPKGGPWRCGVPLPPHQNIRDPPGKSQSSSPNSGSGYSADASSGSPESSALPGKLPGNRDDGAELLDYDIPKPHPSHSVARQQPAVNLEDELREIDGLIREVQQTRVSQGSASLAATTNRNTLDGFEMHGLGKSASHGMESKRSSSSNQETLSSQSGSNDNLGVWDDVSFEEESEGSDELEGGVRGGGDGGEEGGAMLDSWIKELESGIQGMTEVAGIPATQSEVLYILYVIGWDNLGGGLQYWFYYSAFCLSVLHTENVASIRCINFSKI